MLSDEKIKEIKVLVHHISTIIVDKNEKNCHRLCACLTGKDKDTCLLHGFQCLIEKDKKGNLKRSKYCKKAESMAKHFTQGVLEYWG